MKKLKGVEEYMDRVEGVSTVYSYEATGGIALFSTEPPEGALSGGSGGGEGTQTQATRIRWWIILNEDNTYDGGITGEGWFRNVCWYDNTPIDSPFDRISDEQIYLDAQDGNLDDIFGPWNSEHSVEGDSTIHRFSTYLIEHGAAGCVSSGGIGS